MVIEYTCRMGDPETEVGVPRIKNDLVELLVATGKQELNSLTAEIDPRYATTIVAVSGGYPDDYKKGYAISGMESIPDSSLLFLAGARNEGDKVLTNGGRVFCATAVGDDLDEAINRSRDLVEQVTFEEKYFRRDIGFEFLSAESKDGE